MAMMKKVAGSVKGVKVYNAEGEDVKKKVLQADDKKKCACHCVPPVIKEEEDVQ